MNRIIGTAANDVLTGTIGDDRIEGLDGHDFLSGGAGDDILEGGAGDDSLSDSDDGGADALYGQDGNDQLSVSRSEASGPGAIVLDGGAGDDRFAISAHHFGPLTIDGGTGSDVVLFHALSGTATITLGAGTDVVRLNAFSRIHPAAQIVVTDFETGAAGDWIDFEGYLIANLQNWDRDLNPFGTGHLRLLQSGPHTLLQLDPDGGADSFATFITFQNVAATAFTADNLGGYPSDGTIPAGRSIDGTNAADQLRGAAGDDVINGLGGNDVIAGGAGADRLSGGDGNDYLEGMLGDDHLFGGDGDDFLLGGLGDDILEGGAGNDFIFDSDEEGNDAYFGQDGNDHIVAHRFTSANSGSLTLDGGDGADFISVALGYAGDVSISAGTGADVVHFGDFKGQATVSLGEGRDQVTFWSVVATLGQSTIAITDFETGFSGDEVDLSFIASSLTGWDPALNPFGTGHLRLLQSGDDTLLQIDRDAGGDGYGFTTLITFRDTETFKFTSVNFGGYSPDGKAASGKLIYGTDFNDDLRGTAGDDVIDGLGGWDTIRGGGGDDHIFGREGDDILYGELGDDHLFGGTGHDLLYGGPGDDIVEGGDGDDRIFDNGDGGSDAFYGQGGDDWLSVIRSSGVAGGTLILDGGDGDDRLSVSVQDPVTFTMNGGAGADRIEIYSMAGNATISLGADRDVVHLSKAFSSFESAVIRITDFETGAAGDMIDLDQFLVATLQGWDPKENPFSTGHLRLVQSGADTLLQIDRHGGNGTYGTLITFLGSAATGFTADNLGGFDPTRIVGGAAATTFHGTATNDHYTGGEASDLFLLGQGGNDTIFGGGGDDGFYFGATLTSADRVSGGPGNDQLGLQGDYWAGLGFDAATIAGVEMLVLLSGADARFGDTAGNHYSYRLTMHDGNVAAGERLTVNFNTLRVGENVTFDGSAETDGHFLTYAGLGHDDLTGGQADDGFYFGHARFGAGDRVDGQGGADQIGLQGNYSGAHALAFGADQIRNVEMLVLMTGGDTRFGSGGSGYSYDLTMHDANVVAGTMLTVNANTLRSDESLTFDGSAETDGNYRIFSGSGDDHLRGGAGNDQLWGGAGDDILTGGLGADMLRGGSGDDRFVYLSVSDSTAAAMDHILDFSAGDRIDLQAIDANIHQSGNQGFAFIGSSAFSGSAGELRAYLNEGHWRVEGDVNGDGLADLVIAVTTVGGHALAAADFWG
ncbi:MAG: calcium-binding protein [Allosphingosinicella sp.]|uniref:calcium-binding protein n=1 Tax=Allosphingosinicella sp. TaxID=2823234 RepID=UPI003926DC83